MIRELNICMYAIASRWHRYSVHAVNSGWLAFQKRNARAVILAQRVISRMQRLVKVFILPSFVPKLPLILTASIVTTPKGECACQQERKSMSFFAWMSTEKRHSSMNPRHLSFVRSLWYFCGGITIIRCWHLWRCSTSVLHRPKLFGLSCYRQQLQNSGMNPFLHVCNRA